MRKPKRMGLTLTLVLLVFFIMLSALILASTLMTVLDTIGILGNGGSYQGVAGQPNIVRNLIILIILSSFLGIVISTFVSKRATKSITKLISATRQIARGDFSVRVDSQGIRELEELSGSFNSMAGELASIETMRSDFINNFSHEFKTPIVSIKGFAELLHEGGISKAEQKEYLEIIISESKRLAALSTNVLNLSKFETTTILTEKTIYRLDEQIRKAVLLLEPKWSEKNIEIDIDLDEAVFDGNKDLLQQVWINLLDNAIKFSHRGDVIGIYLKDMGDVIEVSIQDNGIGMDNISTNHAFDKFYQADKSRTGTSHGLGLSIVKRIVELSGGSIKVSSELNEGSVFIIILPK